ncbi:MAG: hypothetical protein CMD74_00390 [Gammaproteobacteria bacterium]|nr:hypothetical protein [Gammaproteobacteria bacterium]
MDRVIDDIEKGLIKLQSDHKEDLEKMTFALDIAGDHRSELTDKEFSLIEDSSVERQIEFSTGRWLAKIAVNKHCGAKLELLADSENRPIWPTGLFGSISHTKPLVLVGVLDRDDSTTIGIDIEQANRVKQRLFKKLFTRKEVIEHEQSLSDWAGVIFSAKESVFKALNPLTDNYLGFLEVEISLNWQARTFEASYNGSRYTSRVIEKGKGYFILLDEYLVTIFIIKDGKRG